MSQTTIVSGTKQVVATQNDEASKWHARLYVNNGETPTLVTKKLKTLQEVEKWAAKVMA